MNADDIFMGWAFWVVLWPIVGIINAVVALPSMLLSKFVNKRAGLIAWVVTTTAILGYGIYSLFSSWQHSGQRFLLPMIIPKLLFLILPQACYYPLTRNRPALQPWIAAALGIGGVVIFILLGALLGATPD